jgi:hypothetical protein
MRDLAMVFIHFPVTIARQIRSGGAGAVVAELLLVKHQLAISNRGLERAHKFLTTDRVIAGLCALAMRPVRLLRDIVVLRPSTFLAIHAALVKRHYRQLFSPNRRGKRGLGRRVRC